MVLKIVDKEISTIVHKMAKEFSEQVKADPFIVTSKLGNSFSRLGYLVDPSSLEQLLHVVQVKKGSLTQTELAKEVGIDPNTLSKILKHKDGNLVKVNKKVVDTLTNYFKTF